MAIKPDKPKPAKLARRRQRATSGELAKARIGDVARSAGVSTATVSRALAYPGKVLAETRERVLKAVKELGYTPNGAARQLRAGSSRTILVVVSPRRAPPFFSEVLRGIDVELSRAGYAVLMGNLDSTKGKEKYLVDLVSAGHIDGTIMLSSVIPSDGKRTIMDAGFPIISICTATDIPAVPAVVVDDTECCAAQTRYLLNLGHRRLLYIAGPAGSFNDRRRYVGFQSAVAEAGLPAGDAIRIEGDYNFDAGVAAASVFLAMDHRPTGVVATSDELAIAFMSTVRRAGVRVPEDVSIVGFDGIEFGDFVEPPLTTIRQPRFDLGATGARMLLAMINGNGSAPLLTMLKGTLVERESAGPAINRRQP